MRGVNLYHYLALAAALFSIGLYGALVQRNTIRMLMSIELMMNAALLNLIAFSRYNSSISGQIFAIFAYVIIAAEVGVGLALVINIYRQRNTIDMEKVSDLKW